MDIPALNTLSEALADLTTKSGQPWSRSRFFGLVVDRALPMRGLTAENVRPVIANGEDFVSAALPYPGRRLAVLSTPQIRDLWLHSEAKTRSVALEPGEPGYLDWSSIKACRASLNRSGRSPESWDAEWSAGDWQNGELMGECEFALFSDVVRVTDETCRVPAETMLELLAISADQGLADIDPSSISGTSIEVRKLEEESATIQDGQPMGESTSPTAEADPTAGYSATRPSPANSHDTEAVLWALFDPVTAAALEKMFPAPGKWQGWVERAARNGLKNAREGRARFNPYRAAMWFLEQGEPGWDLARCHRVLANNLPVRSRSEDHRLGVQLD